MNLTNYAPISDAELSKPSTVVGLQREFPAKFHIPMHKHQRAQLVFASKGVMRVQCDTGTWVVPPLRALWMPAGMCHSVRMSSAVSMRTLYIEESAAPGPVPTDCCVVAVSPLMREVIVALVDGSETSPPDAKVERLSQVFFDLLSTQDAVPLHLPQPSDPRLVHITERLTEQPGDDRHLEHWAMESGASARTLARLFLRETGLSFRTWRQQLRLLVALELLAQGMAVTAVAMELGYSTVSAFVAMFHRSLGTSPGRYFQ